MGLHQSPSEKKCQNRRVVASSSLLTSPAARRPPPKCEACRRQPRGSLLRQTPRWRERAQAAFLDTLSFHTRWACQMFPQELIKAKIGEAEKLVRLLETDPAIAANSA